MAKGLIIPGENPIKDVILEINRFKELTESYKLERADVFAGTQAKLIDIAERILAGINFKEIKSMEIKEQVNSVKNLIISAMALFEKERLERDLSTENVSVLVMAIRELKKRDHLTSSA